MKYRRILFKLSGEALAGEAGFGIDRARISEIASEVAELAQLGVQIGLVVGGGNFFRGISASDSGLRRISVDYMGCSQRQSTRSHCVITLPPRASRRTS